MTSGPHVEVVEVDTRGVVEVVESSRPRPLEGAEVVSIGERLPRPDVRRLDDLSDVDVAPPATPASAAVLVRGADGVFRPVDLAQVAPPQRGSVVHYLDQDPDGPPQQARPGDWVTVIAGDRAGTVYHVQET